MTQPITPSDPVLENNISERFKQLGYMPSKKIRLYGRDCEVVSEPFMEGRNVAIQVRIDKEIRTVRLPSTILQKVLKRAS